MAEDHSTSLCCVSAAVAARSQRSRMTQERQNDANVAAAAVRQAGRVSGGAVRYRGTRCRDRVPTTGGVAYFRDRVITERLFSANWPKTDRF